MSVIQKIQQRQKWVFGAIALALILFIVQDRLAGRGGGLSSGPGSTVGKVNGEAIENADFRDQQELVKKMQQQEVDPDQLSASVWQNLVATTVLKQEFAKAGLVYTNKEFGDAIGSNEPPDWFRNQFTDQQTGVYNAAAAVNYTNQVNQQLKKNASSEQAQLFKKSVLDQTVLQETAKKYQGLIAGAIYVPAWMADKTAADNSSIANISFVTVPYSTIPDSTVKVSNDEVNDYVKKHAKQFEQKDETRQVAYVTFDATPSAKDTEAVVTNLTALKNEFAEAKDINNFLQEKGATANYYDSYLSKSAIHQSVNDSLFALHPGQLYGPYKDGGSFAIARMIDEKQLPDSVKVRHILVATLQQDPQTGQTVRVMEDTTAQKRLDSAIAELNHGANFDSVVLKYSDDGGSKTKGGVYDYFPTGKMVAAFNDFAFTGKVGDKKVVKTEYGFHYVEILGQKGSEPAYKIAYLAKPVTVSQETDEAAQNEASKFAGSAHNLKEFYAAAAKIHKIPASAPGIKENDFTVGGINTGMGMQGGLGKNRQFVQWVYKNDVGDVSPAYRFDQKYAVAIITADNKPGLPGAETARPLVESKITNEKKAKIIEGKMKGSTLEAIAQANNTTVQQADSVSFAATSPKIGFEPKVLGAAFNKDLLGKVSPPIAGEGGVYVIKPNSVGGVPPTSSTEQQRTQAILTLKGQQQYYMQALIKSADIKDYRSKFY